MDFDLTTLITGNFANAIIRVLTISFFVLFVLYSLLTLRQVSIMNHSLVTRLALEIQLLAWFQLVLGILALLVVIFFV